MSLEEHMGRMLTRIERHRTKIRFLFAGALNTLVGLGTFPALYWLLAPLHVHYLLVLTISQLLCITFAFVTNKFLVFKTNGNTKSEYAKFASFHAIYFTLNLVALPVIIKLSQLSPIWSQTVFAIAVIVTSYFWHSRITFSKKAILG